MHPNLRPNRSRDLTDGRSERGRDTSTLTSCFWCEQPHPAEHPLSICPACAARLSTMRSLEMSGSLPLSDEGIDEALKRKSPGNYALGFMDDATFVVFYVGRSDADLRRRLHDWVGTPSRYKRYAPGGKAAWASPPGGFMPLDTPALASVGYDVSSSYTRFAYSYAASAEAAFEKECRNYDDFGGSDELDNEGPPERTPRSSDEYPAQRSQPLAPGAGAHGERLAAGSVPPSGTAN